MRTIVIAGLLLALGSPGVAAAQGDALTPPAPPPSVGPLVEAPVAPPPAAIDPAPAPAEVPVAPAEAPAYPPESGVAPGGRPACVVEAIGVPLAHVTMAALLVCSELGSRGIPLSPLAYDAGSATEVYRVRFGAIGRAVVVELTYERGPVVQRTRSMQLAQLEDVLVAAPRLVTALVEDRPISETARVDNLVGRETRAPTLARSEFFFGLSITGAWPVGVRSEGLYGAEILVQHQTPRFAFGGTARFTGGDTGTLMSIGLGGRYFLSSGDLAAFVGGGAGYVTMTIDQDTPSSDPYEEYDSYGQIEGGGLAVQLEVGFEAMRFHDSRIGAALRIDLPFFALDDYGTRENYAAPVGLQVYCLF